MSLGVIKLEDDSGSVRRRPLNDSTLPDWTDVGFYSNIVLEADREIIMNAKNKTGMNIWDVIFSKDPSHFPIQRNYLQEPHGSNNPINSLVTEEVHQETVDYVRKNITDPKDLYVLDFELNYTIRKLADFILYSDLSEVSAWDEEMFPPLVDMTEILDDFYKWDEDIFCCHDIIFDVLEVAFERDKIQNGEKWDRIPVSDGHRSHVPVRNMLEAAILQQAVQHVIENSDFDWKTKAEAFFRASSKRGYSSADDETIIYLISQSLDDDGLKEEAQHRWRRYKNEWQDMFFTEENPFNGELNPARLRFIHWDKLGGLRALEPQILRAKVGKNPPKEPSGYLWGRNDLRDTYHHVVESQHLFSAQFLSDYVKVFSLFRTDLDVDPIRSHLRTLIGKFYSFVSGIRDFEYNYTVTDISYLSDLLFSFATNRFQHDILGKRTGSVFSNKTRDEIDISFDNSTVKFIQDIPLVTLIALEIHTIFYSRSKGMVSFMHKAKEWLLNKQSPYGYWYDGVNNPEYTTVLVLDALKLIDGEDGLSFPIKTIPHYDDEIINPQNSPVLIIDYLSKTLQYGTKTYRPKIKGGRSLVWEFINNLISVKARGLALPRYLSTRNKKRDDSDESKDDIDYDRIDWKNQYDTISRKFGGNKVLKNFITFNGESYTFTDSVFIVNNSGVMARPDSKYVEKQ